MKMRFVLLATVAMLAAAPSIAFAKPCVLGKFTGQQGCTPVHVPTPNCAHCGKHLN